ncbi:NAD/NADP octopine/nopaline dehydrogenase family protein [bacterium]|nr:NAD/NADP octopine/nopaline dehydrogenase family protein [bacterium]
MKKRKIAILGGGHGARTTAADMSLNGHEVRLFEFEKFHDNVAAIFDRREIAISGQVRHGVGRIALTTHDVSQAINGTDLILIIVPALYHRVYADLLAPCLVDGQNVVLIPGTFGSLEFLTGVRARGCRADITVSELDTLPYATRITGPSSVNVYYAPPSFGIGVFPSTATKPVLSIMKDLYPEALPFRDVLEAGLGNCNPVIHPLGVLMNAGRIEYSRGEFWYYEEGITLSTARAMEALDRERLAIGRKLGLNLLCQADALHALGYGPKGDLWEVLKGSKGLTPIKGPTSLSNRYLTEDIPIGLVCWSQLGEMLGVPTPLMRATVEIGMAVSGVDYWKTGRTLERCGIRGLDAGRLCQYVKTGKPPSSTRKGSKRRA